MAVATEAAISAPHDAQQELSQDGRLGIRAFVAVFLIALVIYVVSPVRQNGDSFLYYPTAYRIVHDRSLLLDGFSSPAIELNYANSATDDGHEANYFPWAPALLLTPVVLGLDLLDTVGIGPGSLAMAERGGSEMALLQTVVASIVTAAVVAMIALIAYDRLRSSPRRRLIAVGIAAVFALGTSLWSVASRAVWQHGPSLLALAIALWCLQRILIAAPQTRHHLLAAGVGASLVASYAFRPGNSISVVLLSAFVLVRRPHLAPYLAGGALAIALPWMAVNWMTYGSLLQPYYSGGRLAVHDHYGEALAANLVSPARGLFVFSPFLVLAVLGIWPRLRGELRSGLLRLDLTLVAIIVVHWLTASAYGHWWAGYSYGPRLMSDVLVYMAALATATGSSLVAAWQGGKGHAARFVAPAVVVVSVAWSVLVHAHGAMVDVHCWDIAAEPEMQEGRAWSWDDPQFLYAFSGERKTCVVEGEGLTGGQGLAEP